MAKRARPDTLVEIVVDGSSTVLSMSLRELRMLDQLHRNDRGVECLFWSLVFFGRCALVEMHEMPLRIGWCREHRDWCDIRAAGPKRLVAVVDCALLREGHPLVAILGP